MAARTRPPSAHVLAANAIKRTSTSEAISPTSLSNAMGN